MVMVQHLVRGLRAFAVRHGGRRVRARGRTVRASRQRDGDGGGATRAEDVWCLRARHSRNRRRGDRTGKVKNEKREKKNAVRAGQKTVRSRVRRTRRRESTVSRGGHSKHDEGRSVGRSSTSITTHLSRLLRPRRRSSGGREKHGRGEWSGSAIGRRAWPSRKRVESGGGARALKNRCPTSAVVAARIRRVIITITIITVCECVWCVCSAVYRFRRCRIIIIIIATTLLRLFKR